MDKCPKCGSKFEVEAKSTADIPAFQAFVCDTCVYADGSTFEGTECLRRQLAAANERAGRLEAQMVELREGWPSFEYVDDTEGMVAIEVPEAIIQNFHRILGGA